MPLQRPLVKDDENSDYSELTQCTRLNQPETRCAAVYITRLPEDDYTGPAPYILHQVVTGKDVWKPGERPKSTVVIRSCFCVYGKDEAESGPLLLELMERVRVALLRTPLIDEKYQLDLGEGLETLVYSDTDKTAPYALGDMLSTWSIYPIKREVFFA